VLSAAVRDALIEIASLGPLDVHAWGTPRIGHDDAVRLIEGEEIYCVIESLVQRGMSPSVIRTLLTSSGVETVQLTSKENEA
jgi:hypothetical protein